MRASIRTALRRRYCTSTPTPSPPPPPPPPPSSPLTSTSLLAATASALRTERRSIPPYTEYTSFLSAAQQSGVGGVLEAQGVSGWEAELTGLGGMLALRKGSVEVRVQIALPPREPRKLAEEGSFSRVLVEVRIASGGEVCSLLVHLKEKEGGVQAFEIVSYSVFPEGLAEENRVRHNYFTGPLKGDKEHQGAAFLEAQLASRGVDLSFFIKVHGLVEALEAQMYLNQLDEIAFILSREEA